MDQFGLCILDADLVISAKMITDRINVGLILVFQEILLFGDGGRHYGLNREAEHSDCGGLHDVGNFEHLWEFHLHTQAYLNVIVMVLRKEFLLDFHPARTLYPLIDN